MSEIKNNVTLLCKNIEYNKHNTTIFFENNDFISIFKDSVVFNSFLYRYSQTFEKIKLGSLRAITVMDSNLMRLSLKEHFFDFKTVPNSSYQDIIPMFIPFILNEMEELDYKNKNLKIDNFKLFN